MIRTVDLSARVALRRLLRLQRMAYRLEAKLVGYRGIPALDDTVRSLRASGDSFYALYRGRKPVGLVSLRRGAGAVEICRLVVHPRFWRRGIASRLLEHAERVSSAGVLEVATAAANRPALELYRRFGFRETAQWTTADGLALVSLRKQAGGNGGIR